MERKSHLIDNNFSILSRKLIKNNVNFSDESSVYYKEKIINQYKDIPILFNNEYLYKYYLKSRL
jgi:hypothetical protein